MAVVAGIDEAGYGPLLGPLTVGLTAFHVPEEALGENLWERFGAAVCKGAPRKSGRLQVADSKVVHKSSQGVQALEANLLPFLGLLSQPIPRSLREHSRFLKCEGLTCLDGYPWYRDRDLALPREMKPEDVPERSLRLGAELTAAGAVFLTAQAEILDVVEFNAEVRRDGCKSVPLARRVAILMTRLWQMLGDEPALLVVDKQGGRNTYSTFLRAVFPTARLAALEEGRELSLYEVADGPRRLHVRFEPRADANHLPVALASMLSKYTRELFMEMFNDYWRERLPGLKPTAGYYEDGQRFLAQIDLSRRAANIPLDQILRSR